MMCFVLWWRVWSEGMDTEVPEMVDMVVKAARAQGNETRGPERSEERHEQR